jgi:hypothetical protein
MSLKYNDGDLLINTTSGCLMVVTNGERGEGKWLTGQIIDNKGSFYCSITPNTWNLYSDYNEDELKVLGNLCNLSKQFMQEKKDGISE